MIDFIKKSLVLPSGNLFYRNLVKIKNFDTNFILSEYNTKIYDNFFERIYSIVDAYSELPVNIEDMLTSDIYFIYHYMIMNLSESQYLNKTYNCYCGNKFDIQANLSNMEINYVNKYSNTELTSNVEIEDFLFSFRRRFVKDNIDFFIMSNDARDNEEFIEIQINFIITSTDRLLYKGEELNASEYRDAVHTFINRDINKLFDRALEFSKSVGIYDKVRVVCPKCRKERKIFINDEYVDSVAMLNSKDDKQSLLEILKNIINEARYPTHFISDIMSKPLIIQDDIYEALRQTDFKSGVILM